jgi:exopolysaccharide/PEP-CTERM locus tyrosine autokinase
MNEHTPLARKGSLLERAAALYGLSVPTAAPHGAQPVEPQDRAPAAPLAPRPEPEVRARPAHRPAPRGPAAAIDRERLRKEGFVDPEAPTGPLVEEFRMVKRQLLAVPAGVPPEKSRTILICSAKPDEGKTFCAVNLALSLAGEQDVEVLLVDGDFSKPEILPMLGLDGRRDGLVDAIADPALDPEGLVVRTEISGLSLLPAGSQASNVTELLASERTREVLARLAAASPKRIILFDSPPALIASPASVLASHAGQLVMVVRADQTSEADLREALDLLSGCPHVSLLLNGAGFAASGRRFGNYYGYAQ